MQNKIDTTGMLDFAEAEAERAWQRFIVKTKMKNAFFDESEWNCEKSIHAAAFLQGANIAIKFLEERAAKEAVAA